MIVDAKTAKAIENDKSFVPGGWATFDDVKSVAVDMRQKSAITKEFKNPNDGPFFVVEMEITQPIKSNIGFVGQQTDTTGGLLRGGGTQVQFDEAIKGIDRNSFLKPTALPKPLN
jgi:filamentous hemagglutinin